MENGIKSVPVLGNGNNDQTVNGDLSEGVVQNTESKLTNFDKTFDDFIKYIGEDNYLVLDKSEIFHFIKLVNYHSRIGFDQYHSSFKIDVSPIAEGFVWLTYNSGLILARSKVAVKSYRGEVSSMLVKVSQFIRAFNSSVECMFLYERDAALYSYLFGGKFYIETISVSTDICSSEFLMKYLDPNPTGTFTIDSNFIDTVTILSGMIKAGSRVEERSVYFKDGRSYIFCGNVLGEFAGIETDITLQLADIASLVAFFSDVPKEGIITVSVFDKYYTYTYNERFVNIGKRKLELSDDMKYSEPNILDSMTLDSGKFKNIISFLSASVGDSTITINQENSNMMVSCLQIDKYESKFPLGSIVAGKGLNNTNIRLALTDIKNFMNPFNGEITVKALGNKFYVINALGRILMFGEV